jgi:hypothetical protein
MDNLPPIYLASCQSATDQARHVNIATEPDHTADDKPATGRVLLVGWMLDAPQPIATYRLVVAGNELVGLFARVGRRFEPIEVA